MPPVLDPYTATSPPRSFILYSIYSTLTSIDSYSSEESEVVPNVAESWSPVDDVTWEFKIKDGLSFPNGEPLDANAVKYSVDYILDPENGAQIAGKLGVVAGAEVIDPLTVRILLDTAEQVLPRLMAALPLVPPGLMEESGAAAFFQSPIGTGYFKVEEYLPGERLTLVPNEYSVLGQPLLDSLTFVVIPEDASRVAALRAGDVNVITKVPTDQVRTLEGEGLGIISVLDPRTYVIDLMAAEGPLANKQVRQAINHAVNWQVFIDTIMAGTGETANGQIVPSSVSGFCPEVDDYAYDPALADQMIRDAGYEALEFTFVSSVGFILNDRLLAEAVANQIEQLETVEAVNVQFWEFSNYLDIYYNRVPRPDFFAWGMSYSPFIEGSVQYERFTTGFPQHNIGYSNADYDALFPEFRGYPEGSAERQQAACELARILHEDAPELLGITLPDIWGLGPEVNGFIVDGAGNPPFELVSVG